jgi:hypothetical protein
LIDWLKNGTNDVRYGRRLLRLQRREHLLILSADFAETIEADRPEQIAPRSVVMVDDRNADAYCGCDVSNRHRFDAVLCA